MITRLESLTFNHDPVDKGHSALSVRRNYTHEALVPEWVAGPRRRPFPFPLRPQSYVVYALAPLHGRTVQVLARIYTDTPNRTVVLSATSKRGLLGGIPKTKVELKSKYTEVLLSVSRVNATGVQRGTIDWTWTLDERGVPPVASWERTEVPVLFTLDLPQAPWTQQSSSVTLPWTDLLRYVVGHGAGYEAGDERWVLGRLVRKLAMGLDIRYDLEGGGRAIYGFVSTNAVFDDTFNLSAYLDNVLRRQLLALTVCDPRDGTWPTPLSAGCYDMAAALVLFAGMLGIPLTYQFVEPYGYLHPLRLVGHPEVTNDVGWFFGCTARPPLAGLDDLNRIPFENHTYVTRADGTICDACVRRTLPALEEGLLRLGAQQATAGGHHVAARNLIDEADGLVIGTPSADYVSAFIDRSTPAESDLLITGGIPQSQTIQFV